MGFILHHNKLRAKGSSKNVLLIDMELPIFMPLEQETVEPRGFVLSYERL